MIIVTRLYHKKIPRSETRATQDVASLIRQSKKIPSDQGTSIIIIPPLKENARKRYLSHQMRQTATSFGIFIPRPKCGLSLL
jgi:hypothetical protein